MTNDEFKVAIGKLRSSAHRHLNDVFIWTEAGAEALKERTADTAFISQKRFTVPSHRAGKKVARSPDQVRQLFTAAYESDLYSAVIVYVVAQVESFLGRLARLRLLSDPRRLKIRVPGIDHLNKIETASVVDASSKDELLSMIINRELHGVFYARPAAYFEYFDRAIGFKLDKDVAEAWVEIKATRDILVHSAGIANEVYVEKAGAKARAKADEKLKIDLRYFEQVITAAKRLIGQAEQRCRKG